MAKWMHPTLSRARTGPRLALTASAALLVTGGLLTGTTATANAQPTSCSAQCINTVAGNNLAGFTGDGVPAVTTRLNGPTGVAEDAVGDLYIGDTINNRVRQVVMPTAQGKDIISTIAGTGVSGFGGDGGQATMAKLSAPTGVAVDSAGGNVFIADTGNNRVRQINKSGIINTIAGSGSCTKNMNNNQLGDPGTGASANMCLSSSLSAPTGILFYNGDVFFSDTLHNVVRELIPPKTGTSWTIVLFAGKGSPGFAGDGGQATSALLNGPTGLAADTHGNVYIADTNNCVVRVVNTSGIINRYAGTKKGTCGYSTGGGVALSAELNHPTGLGFDMTGNLYIADTGNQLIRQVNLQGTIATYAGTPGAKPGFAGDKGPATMAVLNTPTGVVADGSTVYFGDTGNQVIRGIFNMPAPVLPQSSLAVLLPLTGGLVVVLGGSFIWLRRRWHSASVVAG
jgi:hypothetical protein